MNFFKMPFQKEAVVLIMRCFLFSIVVLFSFNCLQAQVPVHEEPRHKPVFENEKVRLLNAVLPPGDTTQYHLHNTPSLFLFLTSTTTGSQLQGGAPTTGRSTAGTLLFENLAPPHVRVHRVWSQDTSTFHVMDIELLSKDSGFADKPLHLQQMQLAIDTPWVRAYKLTLENKNKFNFEKVHRTVLVIALESARIQQRLNGSAQIQTLQQGTFFWVPAGQKLQLKNIDNTPARFAVVEVP